MQDIKEIFINGRYKYISGQFTQLNKAINWQIAIRNIGIKDAFVVAFNGKKQITLKEAKQIIDAKNQYDRKKVYERYPAKEGMELSV